MPRHYRVGVVGFGTAGATATFLLAGAGHEVTLFERAPEVGPVGAGILLQPAGQAVLRRLGLLDQVAALAEPVESLYAQTLGGRVLLDQRYDALEPGCRALGVHRGDLFNALHARVRGGGARVLLGREIVSRRVAKNEVFVRDAAGGEHGPFDFLLIADGARSRLRRAASLTKWAHEYAYGTLWATAPCTAVRGRLHQVVDGSRRLLGLLPLGGGRCSLYWGVRRDRRSALYRRGFSAWRDEVHAFCPLAAELFEHVTSFDRVLFTTYHHVWMPRWHDRHTLFLGDAAHAMSPHLGQGTSLALLDADCFARCLEGAGGPAEAFRAYERERRPHVRYFGAVTFLLSPFFQSDGFVKAMGRDVVLPLLPRLPWVRGQMRLTMAGLKGGFFAGRMRA